MTANVQNDYQIKSCVGIPSCFAAKDCSVVCEMQSQTLQRTAKTNAATADAYCKLFRHVK